MAHSPEQRRRNARTALLLAGVAVAMFVGFFISVSLSGG